MGRTPHFYVILALVTAVAVGCSGPPRYTSKARPAVEQQEKPPARQAPVDRPTSTYGDRARLKAIYSDLLGTRYAYGGQSSRGFDCSGLMQRVYWEYDRIRLPRTVRDMYRSGHPVSGERLKTGDLVFFNTTGRGPSHVGMYLWNDVFLHASRSEGVTLTDLDDGYWSARYLGARRVLD